MSAVLVSVGLAAAYALAALQVLEALKMLLLMSNALGSNLAEFANVG